MASKPKSKFIAEVLAAESAKVFAALRAGTPLDEIGKPLGIFPFQIVKFYGNTPEFVETFREAVATNEKMRQKARDGRKRRANGEAVAIVERNRDDILRLLADGKLVAEVGELYEISRSVISGYFTQHPDDDVKAAYLAALKEGGGALADEATLAARRPAFNLVDAKMAELRSRQLAWHAAKRDPAFADRQQVDLNAKVSGSVSIDIQI